VAAQRRDSQRRTAPTPHGQLQSPATENSQVSKSCITPPRCTRMQALGV